ncbi:hypothetical protein D3C87_1809000 [compost metagenome]
MVKVRSSLTSSCSGTPPGAKVGSILGTISVFRNTSLYQNSTSSVVTGSPSDHFSPSRSVKVNSVELSLTE